MEEKESLSNADKDIQYGLLRKNYKALARVLIYCAWHECDKTFFQDKKLFDFYCYLAELNPGEIDYDKLGEQETYLFKYLRIPDIQRHTGIQDKEEIKKKKAEAKKVVLRKVKIFL